jgi:N-acetylglucosamine kinase-like BadF-type ATPase
MSLYLAIDAGGTKADYLLADETRELARARSGTIKRMRIDAATATANLDAALAELTALSGLSMRSVTRTCIGTAGQSVPLVADFLREALTARVSGDLLLLGDVEIALDAAFPGNPGIVVIAGTGSNVAGRASDLQISTAGGWGPALADEGSGHGIGRSALRALVTSFDQHRPTQLREAIFAAWNITTPNELIEKAHAHPAPDLSRLAEVVLRCAQQGDELAAEILQHEGEALAATVDILIRRLQQTDPAFIPSLAFTGSIMEKALPVREALIARLNRDFANVETLPGVVDPIAGALWRARHS